MISPVPISKTGYDKLKEELHRLERDELPRVMQAVAEARELGDLREATLRTVLSSALKKEVRKALLGFPRECLGCVELDLCMGGCRGRTFASTGSLDRRDPACE